MIFADGEKASRAFSAMHVDRIAALREKVTDSRRVHVEKHIGEKVNMANAGIRALLFC